MKSNRVTNILLTIIVILLSVYIYLRIKNDSLIEVRLKSAVSKEVSNIRIPQPKDGKDATQEQIQSAVNKYVSNHPIRDGLNGQNASDEQVKQAVNTYMKNQPKPRNGSDGKNGLTPEIRCSTANNRWEVRYGQERNWQLLNGENVACTSLLDD